MKYSPLFFYRSFRISWVLRINTLQERIYITAAVCSLCGLSKLGFKDRSFRRNDSYLLLMFKLIPKAMPENTRKVRQYEERRNKVEQLGALI